MTYENAKLTTTTAFQTFYTAPSNGPAIVRNIHIANPLSSAVTVNVRWRDFSDGNAPVPLLPDLYIPANSALAGLEVPIVLEANDSLQALSNVAGVVITLALGEVT